VFSAHTCALIGLLCIFTTVLFPLVSATLESAQQTQKQQEIKTIIFDLGGVLFNTDKTSAFKQIGIIKVLNYLLRLHNPFQITKKLYNILDAVCPLPEQAPRALTPDGSRLLPKVFHDWLSGRHSPAQISESVSLFISQHPERFASATEQQLIKAAAQMTFTPQSIAKIQCPVQAGVEFVKKCKKQGFDVMILSNLDAESFKLLQKKYSNVFELFKKENIFISGKMGQIKPDPAIYETLLRDRCLDPSSCIFIDDQKENIESARKLGIHGILCKKKKGLLCSSPDFAHVQKELDKIVKGTTTIASIV